MQAVVRQKLNSVQFLFGYFRVECVFFIGSKQTIAKKVYSIDIRSPALTFYSFFLLADSTKSSSSLKSNYFFVFVCFC